MSSQLMLAFLLFSTSIAITPGAGNIALLGISSRYGFAATLPFISGNAVGIIIVLAGSSVGLVSLFTLYPELYNILKYAGAAYLLFMAWSIANMQIEESTTDNRSGFMSGVLVQVLNPKGWIASLTVFSQFITPNADYLIQVVTIIAGMVITGVPCMLVWAYCGTMLKKLLRSPKQ
ncbi:LysE family translocator, partial [Vibrio coralliirubri]|uniref:LysE family translocator n=1 Tax=Vibrio coralliirubri TaxID=1516159 RepID=UPI002FCE81C5